MPEELRRETILFPNQNKAVAIFPPPDARAEEIVAELDLKPYEAVILIIGGAGNVEERVKPRLADLFGRGIARAADDANALVIDGGTQAGVMAMIGQGVADRGFKSSLIGVAPTVLVAYPGSRIAADTELDPNHSHFVLVEGNAWGSELASIFNLYKVLSSKAPGLVIIAAGGSNTRAEALHAVRQRLPLIVVEGSGGVADEIAAAWRALPALPADPALAEIIADGRIKLHPLSNPTEEMARLVMRTFDNVLLQAWEHFRTMT